MTLEPETFKLNPSPVINNIYKSPIIKPLAKKCENVKKILSCVSHIIQIMFKYLQINQNNPKTRYNLSQQVKPIIFFICVFFFA